MRILVVEDDVALAERVAQSLQRAGFLPELCHDGEEAAFLGATERYAAAVVDLGLPGRDGISLIRHWREQGSGFPVLILTARGRWSDKLAGFGAGGDDYLTKPFQLEEVALRLRALLRRVEGHAGNVVQIGPLRYDTLASSFSLDDVPLSLTAQEQRILAYLALRAGQLVTRSDIAEQVYQRDLEPDSNTVDVLIGRIRKKLGYPLIRTERGLGFRLVDVTE